MPESEDGFEEVQALLKAEAERRGITVEELTVELARGGRRNLLDADLIIPEGMRPDDRVKRSDNAMLRLITDPDPQSSVAQWHVSVMERGGTEKTVVIGSLPC